MLKAHLVDKALTMSLRLPRFNCWPEIDEKLLQFFNWAALRIPNLNSPSSPLSIVAKYKMSDESLLLYVNVLIECRSSYRRNRTASPDTSFFLLTNALHPVVSKCLRGCPVFIRNRKYKPNNQLVFYLKCSCPYKNEKQVKNLCIYAETSIPGRAGPLPQALVKVFVESNPKEEVD